MTNYIYEWDNVVELDDWDLISGESENLVIFDGTLTMDAEIVYQTGHCFLLHKTLIPFNSNFYYIWTLDSGDINGYGSIGFIGYASDGVTIVDTVGTTTIEYSHWHCTGEEVPNLVTRYTKGYGASYGDLGLFGGESYAYPAKMHPDVAFVRIAIIANIAYWQGGTEGSSPLSILKLALQSVYDGPGVSGGSSVYSITPDVNPIYRGGHITFAISATDFSDGNIFWKVVPTNASCQPDDFVETDFGATLTDYPKGSAIIISNSGSATIYTKYKVDYINNDIFKIQLRTGSETGTLVYESSEFTIEASSYSYTLTVATLPDTPFPYIIGEGSTVFIRIEADGPPVGTSIPFTITGIQVEDIDAMWINGAEQSPPHLTGIFTTASDIAGVELRIANDLLIESAETATLTLYDDTGGTLHLPTPAPSASFTISGVYIPFEINSGFQTFDAAGNIILDMSAKSFMAVVQGTATISNGADGTVSQDFYVTDMASDENWTISLHLPKFTPAYKVWYEVFTGFFRIYFYRDTTAGTAPTSINYSYTVYRS